MKYPPMSLDSVLESLAKTGYCVACPNPAEYHRMKPLLRNCLSYSSLKWFAQSPFLFAWKKALGEEEPTQAMRIGSAADCLALTPEYYASRFAVVDRVSASPRVELLLSFMSGKKGNWSVEEKKIRLKQDGQPYANGEQDPFQKAGWEARIARGEVIFSPEEKRLADALLNQKRAGIERITEDEQEKARSIANATLEALRFHGLESALPQVAVWCRLESVGAHKLCQPITLCFMADLWQEEKDRIVDMKSTGLNIFRSRKLAFSIDDMGYNIQAGVAALMYKVATGRDLQSFADLFVAMAPPHFDRLMEFDRPALEEAQSYVMQLLVDYDKCVQENNFGSPHLEPKDYQLEKTKPITVYETEEE